MKKDKSLFKNSEGKIYLPSLLSLDQENRFSIKRKHTKGKIPLDKSLKLIREFDTDRDYAKAYLRMSDDDKAVFVCIAQFTSINYLQLMRLGLIHDHFPTGGSKLNRSLAKLIVSGLIQEWEFANPSSGKKERCYTLTDHGARAYEYLFGNNGLFAPKKFFQKYPLRHLRKWYAVDLYEVLFSLNQFDSYKNSYSGTNDAFLVPGAGVYCLETNKELFLNMVTYVVLQSDQPHFLIDKLEKWENYIARGHEKMEIPGLIGSLNALTFFVPTIRKAAEIVRVLELHTKPFSIFFIVAEAIVEKGVTKSFYIPSPVEPYVERINASFLMETDYEDTLNITLQ